jgi:hypothetical protein
MDAGFAHVPGCRDPEGGSTGGPPARIFTGSDPDHR